MDIVNISYEDNEKKTLDEVVVKNIDMLHIERLDEGRIWITVNSGEERLVIIN